MEQRHNLLNILFLKKNSPNYVKLYMYAYASSFKQQS